MLPALPALHAGKEAKAEEVRAEGGQGDGAVEGRGQVKTNLRARISSSYF